VLGSHRDVGVPELARDVPELHAGGEELARMGVAEILEADAAELRSLPDPPPLLLVEVARVEPLENERLVRRSPYSGDDEEWSMIDLRDRQLMGLYAHGSQSAFQELFRRYEGRAYAYFLRRVRSDAQARDLYQELFLRLHRFRHTYDTGRPFEPWFFHIAHRVLVDDWRRRHRQAEVGLEEARLESPGADPEQSAAARHESQRQLERLSPEEARILVDAKVRGLEYAEIAAALSKSVAAVKQVASRSLRRLRMDPAGADQAPRPSGRASQRPSATPA
jgi:RNA polymerase sigma-70 factor (ECF subfamily)